MQVYGNQKLYTPPSRLIGGMMEKHPDGNVHTMPTSGPEHEESKDCWCEPELLEDYSSENGVKCYLHKEIQ